MWTLIRDRIVIDQALAATITAQSNPSDGVLLMARQILHAPGYVLSLPAFKVVIVADEYDAAGGAIVVSGVANGSVGPPGSTGTPGRRASSATANDSVKAGIGGIGWSGGQGGSAGTVQILCRHVESANLQASGGQGGKGGPGGTGGSGEGGLSGGNHLEPVIIIYPVHGRTGGTGGVGGTGGPGGLASLTYITSAPGASLQVTASGGAGGPGGDKGLGGSGWPGTPLAEAIKGADGSPGGQGSAGENGTPRQNTVVLGDYWIAVQNLIGGNIDDWIAHRMQVGIYNYRYYNPAVPGRTDALAVAMNEFESVLGLRPNHPSAIRYRQQLLLNQNVLGYPRDLDVIPDFERYSDSYSLWSKVVLDIYHSGLNTLLGAQLVNAGATAFAVYVSDIGNQVNVDTLDRAAAAAGSDAAIKEAQSAKQRVDDIIKQVEAAKAEMENQSISILGVLGSVAKVAGAVVAVVGAVETGGASLLALGPALATVAKTTIDNVPDIIENLFDPDEDEIKELKDAYGAVKKDIDDIVGAANAVISLDSAIRKLIGGITPDNSKYVALVKQAVDLGHALLIANLRAEQAKLTLQAREQALADSKQLEQLAQQQLNNLQSDVDVLKDAGLTAISVAQQRLDALLSIAFYAQRSVEIYTLQDQNAAVFFDSGFIHPDLEAEYKSGTLNLATLISRYLSSSANLLNPITLQIAYERYFAGDGQFDLTIDVKRLSFTDPEALKAFRDNRSLSFSLELPDLRRGDFEEKIERVDVALIGASVQANRTICQIRHGSRYAQLGRDGQEVVTLLKPRTAYVDTPTTPLATPGLVPTIGAATLTAPGRFNLWGRGVCGAWELTVPPEDPGAGILDLSALSEIQVWVAFQTFVRRA